ncbi:MAG: 3-hydroxyacyl-ACP dehydratase FabZ [Pseudomonadota bacterium]
MTDAAPSASLDEIKRLIPHRYPFLMIDKVNEIVMGESAVGIKCVTNNEPHFTGHFPSKPVMPGVLIVEAMAQTAAVLAARSMGMEDSEALVFFMGLDKTRFRTPVEPGDVLELHVKVLRGGKTKTWKFAGTGMVAGKKVCEAEFTAMIDADLG